MRIYKTSETLEPHLLQEVIELLDNQELIIYPTETCYGLGGDVQSPEAVDKVFKVKQRSHTNPIHIAVSSLEMARHYVKMDHRTKILFEHFLPGPLTLILETQGVLPPTLSAGRNTLGIRCPGHPIPLQIIDTFGRPITATSANLSGQPSAYTANEAINQLENCVPAIIDLGRLPYSPPSTLVDLTSPTPHILREGPIQESDILRVLKKA